MDKSPPTGPVGFGARLRELRKERRLTQEALADKLRIGRGTMFNLEAGTTYPRYWDLLEMSKFFSLSLDELVYGAL